MVDLTHEERTLIGRLIERCQDTTWVAAEMDLCNDILYKLDRPEIVWAVYPRVRVDVELACGHETWVAVSGLHYVYCVPCNKMSAVTGETVCTNSDSREQLGVSRGK